jgi:hypothetical protein
MVGKAQFLINAAVLIKAAGRNRQLIEEVMA